MSRSDDIVAQAANPALADEFTVEDLRRLDESRGSPANRKLIFTAAMGFFTDSYDLFVIGVVLTILVSHWGINSAEKSAVGSVALITSALGAWIFGRLADKFGRKSVYGWEVLVLAVGAIASAFAPNIWYVIAARGLMGFGIGGDYPVSATIMSEYSGRCNRGKLVAMVFSAQGVGLAFGPLFAIGLLGFGVPQMVAWRVLLGFGALPALSVFWLRRRVAETPRFRLASRRERLAKARTRELGYKTGLRAVLSSRRSLKWLIGVALSWFMFDVAYYGNTIASTGVVKTAVPNASIIAALAITLAIFLVMSLPFYYVAAATIDRFGHKRLQWVGFTGMAAAFLLLAFLPGARSIVVLFVFLFGFTYVFAQWGPNTSTFIMPTELFPSSSRTTSHGFAAGMGKMGGYVGASLLPVLAPGTAFMIAGIACGIGIAVTALFLPEPSQRTLEELSGDTGIYDISGEGGLPKAA